ncbi:MAG TPA: Asp-tRNA(Asn)/Glu-tRNA(Gln) amidotransferase subunit GatC [Gemmatimonadaceae bacterium]|jgi:aspartyl-tRNA(Asn)/glutamyl-tRNA(Gln) amidotransferase subunit C|nr:Asp-tRNA(Asn)/Glu-tRNA(Gln) amidotransferase subunit GatC [Gemmatimonadaceae bacterium]
MAVSLEDVRHVATLARLGLSDDRARALVAELNTILEHMDVLSKVETDGIEPVAGIGAAGTPLRPDSGPPDSLAHPIDAFAPRTADGFFLVPRLSTHEDPEEA